MKEKNNWNIQFPLTKKVVARTLAQDIKGFDPSNPKDVEEWGNLFKEMFSNIKKKFDEKGIPMPGIVIDSTPAPITYGIKTTDASGNIIHSLL